MRRLGSSAAKLSTSNKSIWFRLVPKLDMLFRALPVFTWIKFIGIKPDIKNCVYLGKSQ